jgi:glutamine synthetase adenylyltransferase
LIDVNAWNGTTMTTGGALSDALAKADLRRGYMSFEHFLERLTADPALLEKLDADPKLAALTLDLFEHSPYFAEELIRTPELVDEIGWHDVAFAVVVARIAREHDTQSVADRDPRRDDQETVGEARILRVSRLVERLPGDEHRHHDRLA